MYIYVHDDGFQGCTKLKYAWKWYWSPNGGGQMIGIMVTGYGYILHS